jgi:hypothetical protein
MKISFKSYWKPTPKLIRKIADSILAGSTLFSTYSYLEDHKGLALAIMIVSVVAKILSNFFEDGSTTT